MSRREAEDWARSKGMLFVESSAKTKIGIQQVFNEVVQKVRMLAHVHNTRLFVCNLLTQVCSFVCAQYFRSWRTRRCSTTRGRRAITDRSWVARNRRSPAAAAVRTSKADNQQQGNQASKQEKKKQTNEQENKQAASNPQANTTATVLLLGLLVCGFALCVCAYVSEGDGQASEVAYITALSGDGRTTSLKNEKRGIKEFKQRPSPVFHVVHVLFLCFGADSRT